VTFDLLTSNLERVIARGVVNLPTNLNLGVLGNFSFSTWANICQMDYVTLRPWPLTSEVMALKFNMISLKFVGLSVRKIWHTFDLSINRPGDLDVLPWNKCALLSVGWATVNHPTNFGVPWNSRLMGQQLSDRPHDLATLTLVVTALVGDTGLRDPSAYQDWSSQAFLFGRYDTFSVSALVGLVTLSFWRVDWKCRKMTDKGKPGDGKCRTGNFVAVVK